MCRTMIRPGRRASSSREEEKQRQRQAELNISSPNSPMSNSHLINETFSISSNADLPTGRVRNCGREHFSLPASPSHVVYSFPEETHINKPRGIKMSIYFPASMSQPSLNQDVPQQNIVEIDPERDYSSPSRCGGN